MFLENQETLKKEFSNNFYPTILKASNINYPDNIIEKKIIDSKFLSINYLEDEVQNLFHSFDSDDFNNTDYLYDKRIYEITNNSDRKEKKLNDKIVNSYNQKKQKIFRIKKIRNLLGRRKLNKPELYSCGANHTKFREDNIVRKVKIYFTNT